MAPGDVAGRCGQVPVLHSDEFVSEGPLFSGVLEGALEPGVDLVDGLAQNIIAMDLFFDNQGAVCRGRASRYVLCSKELSFCYFARQLR